MNSSTLSMQLEKAIEASFLEFKSCIYKRDIYLELSNLQNYKPARKVIDKPLPPKPAANKPVPQESENVRYSITVTSNSDFAHISKHSAKLPIADTCNKLESDSREKYTPPRPTSIQEHYRDAAKKIEEEFKLISKNGSKDVTPFSQRVVEILRERFNHDSVEFYKAAHIDRRLFSKIISDPQRHPSKKTAIYLALAAKFTLDEAIDFIQSAGYFLSNAIKEDIIYIQCFKFQIYSIDEVESLLQKYLNQSTAQAESSQNDEV